MGSEWSVAAFCRSDGIGYHPEHKRALQGHTEALQGFPDADEGRVADRFRRVYGDPSFAQGAWNREGLRSPVKVTRVRRDKKAVSLAHFLMLLPLIPKAVVLTRDEMFGRMGT